MHHVLLIPTPASLQTELSGLPQWEWFFLGLWIFLCAFTFAWFAMKVIDVVVEKVTIARNDARLRRVL